MYNILIFRMKKEEIKLNNDDNVIIVDYDKVKILSSNRYNYIFNKSNGLFIRWGENKNDDGDLSLGLPEILDIEISTTCHGIGSPCKFCYKSNTINGKYMNLETFEKVFNKMPLSVTQIAFGIGDIDGNPDMWKIFEYCHNNGVIPNVTINCNRMTTEYFDKLSKYCGAVACSYYNKYLTYNAIKELTDRNMKQVNMHYMISEETIDNVYDIINDIINDERLSKMNSIVFLSLKQKGNAINGFTQLSQDKFNKLCDILLSNNIKFGFDSCTSCKFLNYLKINTSLTEEYKKELYQYVEPCESSIYSSYISVDAKYYPCSFCEGVGDWKEGISILDSENFLNDVWYNDKTNKFRSSILNNNRNCIYYKI